MLKSYLNTALRNLLRQKSYTIINIIGLSSGIMVCLIILLYVNNARSFEKFYPDSEQIYRVTSTYSSANGSGEMAIVPARLLEVAYSSVPETNHLTLLNGASNSGEILIEIEEDKYLETEYYAADTAYFNVFEHNFVQGDPTDALLDPKSVVLTASTALKYFGKTDVYGEPLKINGTDRIVGGVIDDFEGNSVLKFNILISTVGQSWINSSGWYPLNYNVFAKFNSEEQAATFQEKLNAYVLEERREEFETEGRTAGFNLEPIGEMYFNTSVEDDFAQKLPRSLMQSLIAISLFILVIACINYINLSTAKSEKRAKEVGIRKVMGAMRGQLIWQFYGETFVITLISVVVGVVLTEVALVPFNNILGMDLSFSFGSDPVIGFGLVAIVLLVSFLAGSYPASFLSSFRPVKVLKGDLAAGGGNSFRRVLVTLQFAFTVFLIFGTITMARQLKYIQDKEMGFEQDEIVYLKLSDRASMKAYESMKNAFRQIPGVVGVTGSNNLISNVVSGYGAFLEGGERVNVAFKGQNGDEQFYETMGMTLLAGESFVNKSNQDSLYYYLINETASNAMNLTPEEAVGKKFSIGGGRLGTISGVVQDFHMNSIHSEISAWAVVSGPDKYMNYMFAKVNMNRIEEIKSLMAREWESRVNTFPFELHFVNDSIREAYHQERQLSSLIISFTALAIIIGCLGLFGLASYLAEKRSKEIGIRKVLGANVSRIVYMLSKEYLKIILIANLIAWPVGFYFMNEWLQTFAYRIDINWVIFLLAGLSTVLVAGFTVSYQSIKAAVSNPINALRSE